MAVFIWTYKLLYEYKDRQNSSFLSEISFSSGNKSFNPIKFQYGQANSTSALQEKIRYLPKCYPDSVELEVRTGKFDYHSGNDGLIIFPAKNPYLYPDRTARFADDTIYVYNQLDKDFDSKYIALKRGSYLEDILCANIDGKGDDEVIKIENYKVDNKDMIFFTVYESDPDSILALKYTREYDFSKGTGIFRDKFYYTGDFNGDGKAEILILTVSGIPVTVNSGTRCCLYDLESGEALYHEQILFFLMNKRSENTVSDVYFDEHKGRWVYVDSNGKEIIFSDKIFIADYDGDGKDEIYHVGSSYNFQNNDISDKGVSVHKFVKSDSSYQLKLIANNGGVKKSYFRGSKIHCADINGDNKADIIASPTKVTTGNVYKKWTVFYSNGDDAFETKEFNGSFYWQQSPAQYYDIMMDLNDDGKSDWIELTGHVSLSKNNVLVPDDVYPNHLIQKYTIPLSIANGKNASQFATFTNNTVRRNGKDYLQLYTYHFPRNDRQEKMLTEVTTSTGVVYKNYYEKLNPTDSFYIKGNNAVFPYENIYTGLIALKSTQVYVDEQETAHQTYRYENAVIHKHGLGFCGFEKVIIKDEMRNQLVTKIFDPFNFGVLKSEDSPLATTSNEWTVKVEKNKTRLITLKKQTNVNKLSGFSSTTDYTYNTYGYPVEEKTVTDGKTITISRGFISTIGILGMLVNEIKTTTYSTRNSHKERMSIPKVERGLPKERIYYFDSNQISYETFDYDARGNLTRHGVLKMDSKDTLITKYEYNDYGSLYKMIDPMNFATVYSYNQKGYLSFTRNHKQQFTYYEYDDMGTLLKIINPDGTISTSTRSWTKNDVNALYCITSTKTGLPSTKTYYDRLGREVRSSTIRPDGRESHIDKQYDVLGRLQKVSLPFIEYAASLWNEYEYDDYDRLLSLTEASGKKTTYSYSGNSVCETKDGIPTTRYYNALGKLTSVIDPAGMITYNLRADGQPSEIVTLGNIKTTFSYDKYGRQKEIVDPSAGTKTFSYYPNGSNYVYEETDANGNTSLREYDRFGRLVYKETNGTEESYYADYKYNSDGLLESEVGNNTNKTYKYDYYLRLISETETVGTEKLQKVYNYNANTNSLASKVFYVNDIDIAKEEYSYLNGYHIETSVKKATIWRLESINAFGQPTSVTTGNFTREYGYDDYGYLISRKVGKFMDFAYKFDPLTGNMMSRTDNMYGKQENFRYDNLNRLTTYGANTATYFDTGNIKSLSDVGTFYYNNSSSPYQQTGAEPATYYAVAATDAIAPRMAATDDVLRSATISIPTTINSYTIKSVTPSDAIPMRNQAITYNANLPISITEGDYTATLNYNADGVRTKMDIRRQNGDTTFAFSRTYLSDCYETDTESKLIGMFGIYSVKNKLYLGGNYYSAPAVLVKNNFNVWKIYYLCRDNLGSITHITDENGTVIQELSYDAWGRLRNPATQTVYKPGAEPELFMGRGYTGHEHLTQFGLINMNARLYDPALGRFLSPDPYVQMPDFSQSYNRYMYAMNNPMRYTDKNGEWIGWVAGGLVMLAKLYYDGYKANNNNPNPTQWNWSDATYSIGYSSNGNTFYGGIGWNGDYSVLLGYGNGNLMGGYAQNGQPNLGRITPAQKEAMKTRATNYAAYPDIAEYDQMLMDYLLEDYGIGVGTFGISQITSVPGDEYGMTDDMLYFNLETERTVLAYVNQRNKAMHVSTYVFDLFLKGDDVFFKSVIGHELIHAYHASTISDAKRTYTERVAYRYTYDVWMVHGDYSRAFGTMLTALSNHSSPLENLPYWGEGTFWDAYYPRQYQVPMYYRFMNY